MEELFQTIRTANNNYMDLKEKEQNLKEEQEALRDKLKVIEPFSGLECNIHDVMQYHFIKFRFGRVALNYYHKVEKYVSEDLNVILFRGRKRYKLRIRRILLLPLRFRTHRRYFKITAF